MKSHYKLLLIAPTLVLTACGYGLRDIYKGIQYNSSVFEENYFNEWKDAINPYSKKTKINLINQTYSLNESDNIFTSVNDMNFRLCDSDYDTYDYIHDISTPDEGKKSYGQTIRMANYDSSFRYGVISKLFDGQLFCNGYYERSRVQVEPTNHGKEKGFGVLFSKENKDAKYFMMNFKCSLVGKDGSILPSHLKSDLEITISFILKNDKGYTYSPVTYTVDNAPTNSGDSNRTENYICFGFSLSNINTERLIGFTIQYEKIADNYTGDKETQHAMMLYEVSFPKTTWH